MKLLTPHERRVFLLSMKGMGYAEIGTALHISKSYVGTIMGRIYKKIGANNAFQATMIAIRANFFTEEELAEVLPDPKGIFMLFLHGGGKSIDEIALITSHPTSTVRNYLQRITKFLGARNKEEAFIHAQAQGYIAA